MSARILAATLFSTVLTAQVAHADFASCTASYAEVGLPVRMGDGGVGEVQERCLSGFAILYNKRTRTPDWVIEKLTPESFRGQATRSKSAFAADTVIDEESRSTLADYKQTWNGQVFDRGHQAPAADHKTSQEAMNETFLLSNMAPQVGIGFNRYTWSYLEKAIRGWVLCGGRNTLYVMTGPIYSKDANRVLGPNRVAIPEAFFKIVFDPARGRAVGFVMENRAQQTRDIEPFRRSIADIEALTGIDFLTGLPERQQTVLESGVGNVWAYDRSCDARE